MKVLKFLDKYLEEIICVICLAVMTVVVFIQIIFRWLSMPLAWTEEISRYFFIYAVYVGAAYSTKKLSHQKVDLFPLMVGDTGKFIFDLISDLGTLLFGGVLAYFCWQVVNNVGFVFVQKAPATHLNMGWAYAGPALGMTLCAIRAIQNIIFHIKRFAAKRKGTDVQKGEN